MQSQPDGAWSSRSRSAAPLKVSELPFLGMKGGGHLLGRVACDGGRG